MSDLGKFDNFYSKIEKRKEPTEMSFMVPKAEPKVLPKIESMIEYDIESDQNSNPINKNEKKTFKAILCFKTSTILLLIALILIITFMLYIISSIQIGEMKIF